MDNFNMGGLLTSQYFLGDDTMLKAKSIKVVSTRFRNDFENDLSKVVTAMEENVEIRDIDIQFSTANNDGHTYFTALVIGKGI